MSESARAFLRHTFRVFYRDSTRIAEKGVRIHWTSTFYDALLGFRSAAYRRINGFRRLYAHRRWNNLRGVAPEDERERFKSLMLFDQYGNGSLTQAFQQAIQNAKLAANR